MTAVTESAVPERDPTRNREGGATHDAVDHRDSARGREVELPSRRCETHVAEHPQSVVMRGEHEIPRFRLRAGKLDRPPSVIGERNARSRFGITNPAERWNTYIRSTRSAIAGTNWIALAPVPSTATRLPLTS